MKLRLDASDATTSDDALEHIQFLNITVVTITLINNFQ